MATDFEIWVNAEIPRRPAMLTYEIAGYQGDPNDISTPAIMQSSPKGTWYLNNIDGGLWRKYATGALTWETVGAEALTQINSDFSFSNSPSLTFGTVPAGRTVEWASVEVTSAFDSGVSVEIGDSVAHAQLMAGSDSNMQTVAKYMVDSGWLYAANTPIILYFTGTTSTQGTGRVVIKLL